MTDRYAYAGLMVAAAFIFFLARRCFPSPGSGLAKLPRKERLAIGLAAFIGGVLGAKLPFVFVRGADWFGMAWLADGKTVTTGLMGAYLAVELMKLCRGIKAKTGDSFALPLALALAVGRWGWFSVSRLLLRTADATPLGCRFWRWRRAASDPDLRELFPFHDGMYSHSDPSPQTGFVITRLKLYYLHRLWHLSLSHRVYPAGTRVCLRLDLLPVGRDGTGDRSCAAMVLRGAIFTRWLSARIGASIAIEFHRTARSQFFSAFSGRPTRCC